MAFLKAVWRKWLKIAQIIGNFQAQVILTLFYMVLFLPVGFLFAMLADPLRMRKKRVFSLKSNFVKWEHPKQGLEEARKQY